MKEYIKRSVYASVVFLLTAALTLSACGSSASSSSASENSSISSASTAPSPKSGQSVQSASNEDVMTNKIHITINKTELTAPLENNSSARALLEKLSDGDLTLNMHDYENMEKLLIQIFRFHVTISRSQCSQEI